MTKRFGFAFLLFLAASVRADFNFMVQGRLSDGEGNPIGVRTSVEWHLFRGGDPTVADGTPVYRESGFITPVNALGVFSYELGSGTAMDSPLDVSAYTGPEPIYALLLVGGSPLLPKLRVTPVPRSHVAAVAESVQSDGVDTPALKDGAVTGPKIAAGAISGTHLNSAAQLNVDRIGLGGAPATSLDLGAKTDAVRLPLGTIAQRPATPVHGDTRYNTETNAVESYVNGSWQSLSTNAGTVTSVTASTPLASSGGTTPALSIAQADTATGGYLSSSDWNTFNNKLNPALTAGQLFVGNDSNTAVGSPLSGDATLSSAGALTLASTGTAGTYTKVTTDAKGRVVSSATLDAADIPNLDAGKITSGTIDPARIPAGTDSGKLPLAGGTMVGAIDMGGNNITNGGTVAASTITVGGSNVLAASSGLTPGSVLFANGATSAGQDNGNLFWDNTNKRLGVGTAAPSSKLEVVGGNLSINTSGQSRLFSTYQGANSDGQNLFLGGGGLSSVGEGGATWKGAYNTSVGVNAFYSNTTGYHNTAQGLNALYSNTTGSDNTAQGYYALWLNNTGYNNTSVGVSALRTNTNGHTNTATGLNAGRYIADGATANQTSNTSLYLGAETKALANGDTNEIVIGYNATGVGSNSAVLGNDSITKSILKGNVGVGTTSPTATLHLKAGTATANTAPLKFTAGTNLATPEAGAVEFDGSNLYFSTNTTTRQTFAFQGSAGTLSGLTPGSVLFANGAASAGQDNSNLFWDNTNKRLGIGTASPGSMLEVVGAGQFGTAGAQTSQLTVLGGDTGSPMATFSRTSGVTIKFEISLAGAGLTFTDATNGGSSLSLFGHTGSWPYLQAYIGQRNDGTPSTYPSLIGATTFSSVAGSNVPGTDFIIQGSLGTGTGALGNIYFRTADSGGSGSTQQTASTKMAITGAGNVGIGTTSPTAKLHLSSGTAAANTAPLKLTAGTNLTTPEAGAVEFDGTDLYFSTDSATRKTFAFQGSAGTLSGLTPGSVLFANGATSAGQDNTNLFWDNTNKRLGVGTVSPVDRMQITNANTSLAFGQLNGSTALIREPSNNALAIRGWALYFQTNGTNNRMTIDATGNVGVGTISPTAKLHLSSGTAAANSAPLKFTAGTNLTTPEAGAVEFDGSNLYFSTNTTTRQTFAFQGSAGTLSGLTPGSVLFANGAASAGQDNSNLFWDNTNKRLGIRTASPESILDVDGGITTNTTVPLRLKIAGEVSANASEIRTGSGLFKIYSGRQAAAHQSFDFSTGDNTLSGATRLFIAGSSGNVGISTTSPAGKLDVNQPTAGSVAIQAQTSPTVFWKVVSPAGGITGGYSAENAVEYVAKDSGTNRSINAAGTINASGADFAEWVDWAGPQPDMGSIVKYRGAYVVVSSSATAAFVGNDVKDPRHAILVAFAGQLPVWVKGKVNEGDLIVANGDGTGRGIARESATLADAQKAVGTAWASSADDGIKRVHVAVGLGLAGGGWEHEKIKELEREIAEIKRENTAIKERLDQIEKAMTKAK